jgi:hypothetical protein
MAYDRANNLLRERLNSKRKDSYDCTKSTQVTSI